MFGKLVQTAQDTGLRNQIKPDQVVSCVERVVKLERTILGLPVVAEEVRLREEQPHDTQVRLALEAGAVEGQTMSPSYFAEVLKILDRHGALNADGADHDQPSEGGESVIDAPTAAPEPVIHPSRPAPDAGSVCSPLITGIRSASSEEKLT